MVSYIQNVITTKSSVIITYPFFTSHYNALENLLKSEKDILGKNKRLLFLIRYNGSQAVITAQAKNSFLINFKKSI
jgi:hypothetical protein